MNINEHKVIEIDDDYLVLTEFPFIFEDKLCIGYIIKIDNITRFVWEYEGDCRLINTTDKYTETSYDILLLNQFKKEQEKIINNINNTILMLSGNQLLEPV